MEMSEIKNNGDKNLKTLKNENENENLKSDSENYSHDDNKKCNQRNTSSSASSNNLLKPGLKIKPQITIDDVEKLAQRLYGIIVNDIKELNSYDDRNYFINEDR